MSDEIVQQWLKEDDAFEETPKPGPAEYPDAVPAWVTGHSQQGDLAWKNTLVLHASEGSSAASAVNTSRSSVTPNRVSFHFVVDRDTNATVYQCIPIADIAWHASQCNAHSIGIEHAGVSAQGAAEYNKQNAALTAKDGRHRAAIYPMLATDAQYQSSAKLIAWLCKKLDIPCDRAHVRTHNEASPRDGHLLCCTGVLNPDKVVNLAQAIELN